MPTIPQEINESTQTLVEDVDILGQFIHGTALIYIPVRGGTLRSLLYWQGHFQTKVEELAGPYVQQAADSADAAAQSAQASADDALATADDRQQTGLDAQATADDRQQTGLDAQATAADRLQTGEDRTAAAASAQTATEEADRAQGYADQLDLPDAAGNAEKILRQKADESGFEYVEQPYPQSVADQRFAKLAGANDFDTMPTVGGDPIVESDSNSDGEWTRWADGTQQCRNPEIGSMDTSLSAGGVYRTSTQREWTFPVSFYSSPAVYAFLSSTASVRWVVPNGRTSTEATFNMLSGTSSTTETFFGGGADGRWKQ